MQTNRINVLVALKPSMGEDGESDVLNRAGSGLIFVFFKRTHMFCVCVCVLNAQTKYWKPQEILPHVSTYCF